MAYRRRARFGGFGGGRQVTPITSTRITQARRRTKCKGCGGFINVGDAAIRVRFKKAFRLPCGSCSTVPRGVKRFHEACLPSDLNKAMGYNPAQHVHNAPASHTVPPPPKPPNAGEAALAALAALENALVLKLRDTPAAWTVKDGKRVLTPEWESAFKKAQALKARALYPGTPAEGETSLGFAMKQLVNMVFNR